VIDAWLEANLFAFLLILARVGAFSVALPLLGAATTPRLTKAALVLSLSIFWFITLGGSFSEQLLRVPDATRWLAFAVAIGREVALGAIMGFALGLFIVPFRIAGQFIGQEMGLTLGGVTDPTQPLGGTAVGQLFELLGVLILFGLNVHHVFFATLHSTFARRPIGGSIFPVPVAPFLRATAETHEWGLLLAAPVSVCLIITSVFLALLARAAPQMNILSVGFALRLFVGLLATFVLLPEMAGGMVSILERFSEVMYGLV